MIILKKYNFSKTLYTIFSKAYHLLFICSQYLTESNSKSRKVISIVLCHHCNNNLQ